jgi:hypothetical protein
MGNPTIKQQVKTANEQLIGRLAVLMQHDPELFVRSVNHFLLISGIRSGDAEVRKTYNVSLKIDFDDAKRHNAMLHLVRRAARQLLTQATLLADNRQPQVAIECDDFFEGGSKEGLMDLPETPEEDAGDGVVCETPAEDP